MVRGLDGFLIPLWRCAALKGLREGVSRRFPVVMAWGKHLFPFRTEQLSPTAPMVLGSQGPGRVGRRRFISCEGRLVSRRPSLCCAGAARAQKSRYDCFEMRKPWPLRVFLQVMPDVR